MTVRVFKVSNNKKYPLLQLKKSTKTALTWSTLSDRLKSTKI